MMKEKLIIKFEKDFREYLTASIQFAEVQEPYKALSSEDEITWIKNWLKNNL